MWIVQRVVAIGLLGLAAAPGTAADSLGRLFMTPEQRHALDSVREPGGDVFTDAARQAKPGAVPVDKPVVLNGVVRRSRGPDVVWVNGARASTAAGQPVQLRRGPDQHNRVTLENAEGTLVRLKPGQFWDPATGRVADCYGCGTTSKATNLVATPPETTPASAASTPVNAPPADKP